MFLAVREIMHSKTKFSMIIVIFVLLAWLVFILSGLGNGLSTLAAAVFKNMDADYVVFQEDARSSMSKSVLTDDLMQDVKASPDVKDAAAMGSSLATVVKHASGGKSNKVDVAIIGIDAGSFLEPAVIEGQKLSDQSSTKVIVNSTLRDEGFRIGDTLRLDGSKEKMTISGFVENQSYNHLPAVFTPMSEWRKVAFAAPGSDKGIKNPVNAVMLQGENIDPAKIDKLLSGTETVTKNKAVQSMPGYKEESGTISMMLAFLFVISGFVLGVFFYVLTLQKTNQFGIMKAIGADNRFLSRAIVSEVFLLTVISIVTGVLLTYGTAAILPSAIPFKLDPLLVVLYSVALLIIALLSSLISVRRTTKIDPLQALGRVE